MLTRQGWLVTLGAVALLVVGRLFGIFELFVLGAACVALLVLAVTIVVRTRLRLEVGRQLSPRRVHAGTPARVELSVRNVADRRTPVLKLHDPVSGTQGATVLLAPIDETATVRSAYRLPTERRGIVGVGPLSVIVTDPFGLASLRSDAAPRTDLTVLPRVDDVLPPPRAGGDEPLSGLRQATLSNTAGDDFAALRTYVVGDDMRRVHWPSSARHGELLVRQDEVHRQGRTTILLDTRAQTHAGESLEVAVSAVASIITAAWKRQDLLRLLTTDGWDSGFAIGQPHVEAILEFLATVPATPAGTLRGLVEGVRRLAGATSVVAVVGGIQPPELHALNGLRGRGGSVTVVQVDLARWSAGLPPAPAGGPEHVVVTADRPFKQAWNEAISVKRVRGVLA